MGLSRGVGPHACELFYFYITLTLWGIFLVGLREGNSGNTQGGGDPGFKEKLFILTDGWLENIRIKLVKNRQNNRFNSIFFRVFLNKPDFLWYWLGPLKFKPILARGAGHMWAGSVLLRVFSARTPWQNVKYILAPDPLSKSIFVSWTPCKNQYKQGFLWRKTILNRVKPIQISAIF